MYAIDQRVWCKSHDAVGTIIDRTWMTIRGKRRASYLVEFKPGDDYLTGSHDLRSADKFCDGCNKWLPNSSFYGGGQYHNPIDGVIEVEYCFLCTRESRQKGWY